MVTSENGTDGVRALAVRLVRIERVFVHCVKDTPVNGLESVADVRERSGRDNRHGVIEK